MITIGGVDFSIGEAAHRFGVCSPPSLLFDKSSTVYQRIYELGWSAEQAILTPDEPFREKVAKHFGLHVAFDGYSASVEKLTDEEQISGFLFNFPEMIGMTRIAGPEVLSYEGVEPLDKGVTATVTLAESLISLHSFPERDGFVTVDVYSCKCFSPYDVVKRCKEFFETETFDLHVTPRGSRFRR